MSQLNIVERSLIYEHRPEIVDEKSRFGDLEVGLVVGANHNGAIQTIVDRKTKFTWAKFIETKSKYEIEQAFKELLKEYIGKIHTITSDNGKEFACHEVIADLKL